MTGAGSPPSDGAELPGAPERHGAVNLARVLTASGGFVDAVGYVTLFHLFTAHQSGNSDGLGVALALGEWTIAWRRFSAIGAFVVGVLLGTVIVEQCRRWRSGWSGTAVGVAELCALALALGVGIASASHGKIAPSDTVAYATTATSLAAAMGLQNVMMRRVGSVRTPSTFVTGILTSAAEFLVVGLHLRRSEGRRPMLRWSAFLGSLWLVYLCGAISGAASVTSWGFASLGVPMVVIAASCAWQAKAGYEPSLVAADGTQTSGQG